MTASISATSLRLAIYDALEKSCHLTVSQPIKCVDDGTPVMQTPRDLILHWHIATLGASSRIKSALPDLLRDRFWQDESSGLWCLPTAAQREILKRRRARPQQLVLGVEVERGMQPDLGLAD